jgi:uncharacterized protein YfaP (DUF2135 family)
MTQIKQMNTERQQSTKISATNMSSLTGLLFADDYNADANANADMTSPLAVIGREARPKQSVTINASSINASSVTDCFAALAMTAKGNAMMVKGNTMTARRNAITALDVIYGFTEFGSFCNSINSDPFSPFTFYLLPVINRSKPKIRYQRVGIN